MQISPVKRYIAVPLLKYAVIVLLSYGLSYLFIILPNIANAKPEDMVILNWMPKSIGLFFLLLSSPFLLAEILTILRSGIVLTRSTVDTNISGFTKSTQSIPLSQIEYASTSEDFFDLITRTSTVTVASDSISVSISGFDRKQAVEFCKKVSSSQKVRLSK